MQNENRCRPRAATVEIRNRLSSGCGIKKHLIHPFFYGTWLTPHHRLRRSFSSRRSLPSGNPFFLNGQDRSLHYELRILGCQIRYSQNFWTKKETLPLKCLHFDGILFNALYDSLYNLSRFHKFPFQNGFRWWCIPEEEFRFYQQIPFPYRAPRFRFQEHRKRYIR